MLDRLNYHLPTGEYNMPVFTLKSYDQQQSAKEETANQQNSEQERQDKQEAMKTVVIQANDSVAKIVATALYEKLGNDEETKVEEGAETGNPDVRVVSTEDINLRPVDTWRTVKNTPNVVIVNEGFKTDKEEWFLSALGNAGTTVHYSVESYLRTLNFKG